VDYHWPPKEADIFYCEGYDLVFDNGQWHVCHEGGANASPD
jgi:hypothetical protein